ncbi:hypothetical protein [Streptomyces sp. NPDC026673]|uniref:hypothetical protein n=1 Tax=Streptomyces sp. NPDC026673 TaxID=3155724 RepID=UPI0033DDEFE3
MAEPPRSCGPVTVRFAAPGSPARNPTVREDAATAQPGAAGRLGVELYFDI